MMWLADITKGAKENDDYYVKRTMQTMREDVQQEGHVEAP